MHLFGIGSLLLLTASAWAKPVEKRQSDLSSKLVSNIGTLNSDIVKLNGTLNDFTTNDPIGLLEALKIQLQTSQVSNDLVVAARTANHSTAFTSGESNSVAAAILALEPNIFSLLNNIVTHKPAFATAFLFVGDLSLTVEQNLIQQRELSREFSNAVTAKLASPYSDFAPLIAAQIDSAFATAVVAYEDCTGLICLPPI